MKKTRNSFKPVSIAAICLLSVVIFLGPTLSFAGTEKDLHNFESGNGDGWSSGSGLIFDASGNLYGTAVDGGAHLNGIVFQLVPDADGGWTETVIHSFGQNKEDGGAPRAGLTSDALGNLYGTTTFGGAEKQGVVFELTPFGVGRWRETILHTFGTGSDGAEPNAGVILDGSGNLYGTTAGGGVYTGGGNSCGTVFELSPASGGAWEENILYSFAGGSDACGPYAAVVFDTAGNLYGTTAAGGTEDSGAVFELTPQANGGWSEKVIHTFGAPGDGYEPSASLILDSQGHLYGTTSGGGQDSAGTVFKLTLGSTGHWTENILHSFREAGSGGSTLFGSLAMSAAGNLYGTTEYGGTGTCFLYTCGTVFELTPQANGMWIETVLREFDGADGYGPEGNLIFDAAGNLYGTTVFDGAYGGGLVFEITP